jgi:hypothetical protein
VRAARSLSTKEPKPMSCTLSPFFKVFVIVSVIASNARLALGTVLILFGGEAAAYPVPTSPTSFLYSAYDVIWYCIIFYKWY